MNAWIREFEAGTRTMTSLVSKPTHGRFDVEIKMHVVRGMHDGPTLVVQAGLSGLEIEPALVLSAVANEIDPSTLRGTVIVIPMLNEPGFEFEQIESPWDGKHPNLVGRGRADGTVTEILVQNYFETVVAPADAIIDVRTGAQWGYYAYAGVFEGGAQRASLDLAMAMGLPQVLIGEPTDTGLAAAAADAGKASVVAWIGGGPGLRDNRERDMERIRMAVLGAMGRLGMISHDASARPDLLGAPTVVVNPEERGFTFMDRDLRGKTVERGDRLGVVRHPFTGDVLTEILAPRGGVVVHAGASWPVVPEGMTLAIIAEAMSVEDAS